MIKSPPPRSATTGDARRGVAPRTSEPSPMLRKDIRRPLSGTADPGEVRRFDALAQEWWNPAGKFKTVHAFNTARVALILDALQPLAEGTPTQPLRGLRVADVGCGAGLVSVQLARAGAEVVAIDASETSIAVASRHARQGGLAIDYRCALPEELAADDLQFDAVVSLEVVEHVADLRLFLQTLAALVRPGGRLILGTLNRTALSWLLGIVVAERILRWLPRGTHAWSRFVRPEETLALLAAHDFREAGRHGVVFNPLRWRWEPGRSTRVNYLHILDRSPILHGNIPSNESTADRKGGR